jgi:hypothetical protein
MAKYDPLCRLLRKQKLEEFELSFAEIERVLGAMLPNGASHPQWWANVPDLHGGHVQRVAWRDAGFDAFLIVGSDRVQFRRAT